MRHLFRLAFLAVLASVSAGADCGHGGGSPQCPDRSYEAEGPDAGAGLPEAPDTDDPDNAATTTGGSTGGGPDCPQQ